MRVGISMLTLVPGAMGGSESYTRALCRALAAQPDVSAVAFVADSGHAAGEGLETRFVPEYLSGTSTATKISGMAVGVVRRRSIRRRFAGIDVVHYPFTVPIPSLPCRRSSLCMTSSTAICQPCSRDGRNCSGGSPTTTRLSALTWWSFRVNSFVTGPNRYSG